MISALRTGGGIAVRKARITIRLDQDRVYKVHEAERELQTLIALREYIHIATASWRRPCAG